MAFSRSCWASSAGGAGGGPPSSIAALKAAFAAVPGYDGLSVAFGKQPPQHVFRDPKLVINGRAVLGFVVGVNQPAAVVALGLGVRDPRGVQTDLRCKSAFTAGYFRLDAPQF